MTTPAAIQLDARDKRLLTRLQMPFPLVLQPFKEMARELGTSEEEMLERARWFKEQGVIRQISAIFDSRRLGYSSTLIAMDIPAEQIDESAMRISDHPGVSHNYQRNYPFNLWFTLTLPPGADLEVDVARLAEQAGARRTRVLPALRLFKIGVELDLEAGLNVAHREQRPHGPLRPLGEEELAYVRVLQQDLPLEERPFRAWAESLGLTEEALLAKAGAFAEEGIMRRFAAVLRHQQAGFLANGMICWDIPADSLPDLGYRLASYPEVSHCYQRPVYPDWPYSVFSMVHARSRQQCEDVAQRMAADIGISNYVILYSAKEYKKERVKYFVE